jgi:hypothetical protein
MILDFYFSSKFELQRMELLSVEERKQYIDTIIRLSS